MTKAGQSHYPLTESYMEHREGGLLSLIGYPERAKIEEDLEEHFFELHEAFGDTLDLLTSLYEMLDSVFYGKKRAN